MNAADETRSGSRSREWFSPDDVNGFLHRSWLKNQGLPDRMFDGRPVIGICNSFSELTPCNAHLNELATKVKNGVLEAGGLPLEFPVMSLGETLVKPTSMLYRNLVSMDTEESIRANPVDGVVLLSGCDKSTPALIMGAASCDLPTIVLTGGPMLTGRFKGKPIGSGTHAFRMAEEYRAGQLSREDFRAAESCMSRSAGHCNTMGTASTMASVAEALGCTLPNNASIPAVDARRKVLAQDTGARIVEMVREGLRPSHILTREAFHNAIRVLSALGGSTNAVVHLLAIAGRVGVPLSLDDFDRLGSGADLLTDLLPSGQYLMEDFFEAGGLPAVMERILDLLDGDALTVTGKTIAENVKGTQTWNDEVIRPRDNPVKRDVGLAVLHGNLAPDGALIKPSAASPELLHHRGPAVVFSDVEDLLTRIDDPELDVDGNSVLVLQSAGPRGYPGMPEIGNLPIPKKLLRAGVRDIVRVSDARMSGTSFGTVVLHVAPESAAGGPLALVRDGDLIELDVPARSLRLCVPDEELAQRRTGLPAETQEPPSGYAKLYVEHVQQADRGADFDFLTGCRGAIVTRDNHV